MDLSTQFPQQQQQQAYDPSQVQSYHQSTQAFYAYHPYNQQHQQYPYDYNYTYAQDYANAYHQQYQQPASIHPPGVPMQGETSHAQNPCYPHGVGDQHQQQQWSSLDAVAPPPQQQWHGSGGPVAMPGRPSLAVGQTPYMGGGSRGGGSFRHVGVGHFGSRPDGSSPSYRGRGRGRSHAGRFSSPAEKPASFGHEASSQTPGQSPQYVVGPELAPTSVSAHALRTSFWPPSRMAWCELCRVDCNTPEILEQHKNGKKHKKILQVYEEFQKLNELVVGRGQTEQVPVPEVNQEVHVQPEKVERSEDKLASQEDLSSQAGTDENKVESEQQKVSEAAASEEETRKPGMDCFEVHGSKRKMRGGRGGKWMRTHEGSRRSIEPPKPKQAVSLSCELCNVKCESEVVFRSHMNGKKHLSNLKRFQGQQTILEQAALQVLYPALLQALGPPNPNASTSYAPQYHQESVHGFQGFTPQQLAPQIFLPGQVSAPPAKTSASASASSSGLQIQDHQDPKPEQSQAMPEAWSQDAAAVEAKSKPEAEPGDTVQTVT